MVYLEYQWDTIDYEIDEETPMPQFIKDAKWHTSDENSDCEKGTSPENSKRFFTSRFKKYDKVYFSDGRLEYYTSDWYFWPKLCLAFSVVATFVAVVLGVLVAVIMYRVAVSAAVYRIVHHLSGGLTSANLIVSISASVIQVSSIFVLNWIYEILAKKLTRWGELSKNS